MIDREVDRQHVFLSIFLLLFRLMVGSEALGAYVGGLGPLLGLCWLSWGLCWRSWAALGTYVGGLGPKNAKNMPTLKMCLFLERERDLRPGGRS